MARSFALVRPVLHRVSCSNVTIQNAPKHYETLQNMSFGSNGMDRVHSLRQIPMPLCGTNFCINCSSSARFAPSFVQKWNNTKCTQTLRNAPIHEFRVQWGWLRCVCCEKFRCDFMVRTCALISPIQPVLDRVSCSNERLPNAPKYCETHQNMSLGSNGEDRMCCEKFRCDFVAQTFTLIAPVQPILHWVYCRNKTIPNAPKH